MKVTKQFSELEQSAMELTVTIGKKDVETAYNTTVSKYVKSAQIPGFRKGHVPASVLEQKYGPLLKDETTEALIQESVEEALKGEDEFKSPLPYAQPALKSVDTLDTSKDFSYTITYDVKPVATANGLENIVLKVPTVTITDEDIDNQLKELQFRNASVMDKEDGTLAKDDIAGIKYIELDNYGNEVADTERDDFVFTLGSGENPYKFDNDLVGMKVGETKTVKTTRHEEGAEDESVFVKVTVNSVKVRDLPALDDEFAQDVSDEFKTMDDLKANIKKSLEETVAQRISTIKEDEIYAGVAKENPFPLPKTLVDYELNYRWKLTCQRQFNSTPEEVEKLFAASGEDVKKTFFEPLRENVSTSLRAELVFDKLVEDRNIEVTEEEVNARIESDAASVQMSVEDFKAKYFKSESSLEELKLYLKQDKLVKILSEEFKHDDSEKLSFTEFYQKYMAQHGAL